MKNNPYVPEMWCCTEKVFEGAPEDSMKQQEVDSYKKMMELGERIDKSRQEGRDHNNNKGAVVWANDALANINPCKDVVLKYDTGKTMHHLVPMDCITGVAKVLTFGARKYRANSWQGVEPERYFSAGQRHLEAIANGEELDSESNIHHAFHYLCNAVFITWNLIRGNNGWLKEMYQGGE